MSSLRRGHANLLCIVPSSTDDPRRESNARTYASTLIRSQWPSDLCAGLLFLEVHDGVVVIIVNITITITITITINITIISMIIMINNIIVTITIKGTSCP